MADIRCLICNRVNDASAKHCWYCRSPLPGHKEPPTHNERWEEDTPESEPQEEIPAKVDLPEGAAENPVEAVPGWLAHIRTLKAQDEEETHKESAAESVNHAVPEWLENLRSSEQDLKAEAASKKALLEEYEPEGKTLADARLDETRVEETDAGETGENVDKPGGGEALQTTAAVPLESPEPHKIQAAAEVVFPIHIEDLPEWLSSETDVLERITSQEDQTGTSPSSQDEHKLADGVLPAWLKAIRPLEALSPAALKEDISPDKANEGILSGISGTLRSLGLEDRDVKLPSNPHELVVTPAQQKNSELLYRLTNPGSEGTSPRTEVGGHSPRRRIFKLLVAVVLLLAVLLPFGFRSLPVVIPVLFPKEVVDTLGFIEEIPAGKPVLIAAQFEAGLAGELAWTSEPVIEHLISRGIPLALMSTNVNGYAMLEEQLRRASASMPGYLFDDKVVNLGYLPGGMIGLISLVGDARAALPYSTDLEPAWASSPIENMLTLSDFAAVVLLTDNAEIVRAWVEQSGRTEPAPSLLAVVSAQAAPLVQPYHDSGQIQGLVAGSSGALSYQMIRQVPGKASATYPSYQFAVLTAALLIFLGGAVSLITSSATGVKKKEGT